MKEIKATDDLIKNLYDDAVRKMAEELTKIEHTARECSKISGYRSEGLRLQADIVESTRVALQDAIDRGGMPSLNDIEKIMNAPITMIFPKEELDTEFLANIMKEKGK